MRLIDWYFHKFYSTVGNDLECMKGHRHIIK